MKIRAGLCVAIGVLMMPGAALADDPNDPDMKKPGALARDRMLTRQLNLGELRRVRDRDARMFAAYDRQHATHSASHSAALDEYSRSRARYEQEMAAWRRAVAACRAGDYGACGN